MASRYIDPERVRSLARAARQPRGLSAGERLSERFLFTATVTATATAPNRLTLDRHGTAIPGVRYLASYTPGIGDTVLAEYVGDDVMVWGEFA
jgi:hypothetical protein